MNRRNFLGLAPVGIAGLVAMAKGKEVETKVMKSELLTIQGPDGKRYSPLVVEASDAHYPDTPRTFTERARLTSDGTFYYGL